MQFLRSDQLRKQMLGPLSDCHWVKYVSDLPESTLTSNSHKRLQATLTGGHETGTEEQEMANEDPTQVPQARPCAEPQDNPEIDPRQLR